MDGVLNLYFSLSHLMTVYKAIAHEGDALSTSVPAITHQEQKNLRSLSLPVPAAVTLKHQTLYDRA